MESLDLHPEELFDKAAQGLASAEDLARLDTHLASCAACRFERQVRADFDAVGANAGDLDDLVARALSGAKTAAVVEEGPPRRRRFGALLVAAVAMMGFASFAAVAQFTGVLPRLITQLTTTPTPPPPAPTPAPRSAPRVVVPAPLAPEPQVVAPEPAPVVAPSPVVVAPRVVRSVPAPREVVAVAKVEETPAIPPEPDALTLFVRAHYARVHGETANAIRDFRQVVARYPNAPETSLAWAELGQLLLGRGEPASALEAFDAYLASSDQSLREEIRGARALALAALNRTADEREAWEALLRDYPEGVYAPRARARLAP
jgi:hypothetical protein